jgi:hypothetical protein
MAYIYTKKPDGDRIIVWRGHSCESADDARFDMKQIAIKSGRVVDDRYSDLYGMLIIDSVKFCTVIEDRDIFRRNNKDNATRYTDRFGILLSIWTLPV